MRVPKWLEEKIRQRHYKHHKSFIMFTEWLLDEFARLDLVETSDDVLVTQDVRDHLRGLSFEEAKRVYVWETIKDHKGNLSRAAKVSGLARATLIAWVEEWGLTEDLHQVRRGKHGMGTAEGLEPPGGEDSKRVSESEP